MLPVTLIILVALRLIRPVLHIRMAPLNSRIGHLAGNTELYLCDRDRSFKLQKREKHIFFAGYPVANRQLVRMWARCLKVWPAWVMRPVYRLNSKMPDGARYMLDTFAPFNRDSCNLLADTPPHLSFSEAEELRGRAELRRMGVEDDARFVCILGRDDAFMKTYQPGVRAGHHGFRNVNIQNFAAAAEALAERGFYVFRVGSIVKDALSSKHPRVIDYATNGMRSEFMDIYLSARCTFFVTVGTGIDAVAMIFRRPMAYVNHVPLGYIHSFLPNTICLTKNHLLISERRFLSLREIFEKGVGFSLEESEYRAAGVELVENTPDEIRAVVLEMADRIDGVWREAPGDEDRQRKFWEHFPLTERDKYLGLPLHGAPLARYSTCYLRENPEWLD